MQEVQVQEFWAIWDIFANNWRLLNSKSSFFQQAYESKVQETFWVELENIRKLNKRQPEYLDQYTKYFDRIDCFDMDTRALTNAIFLNESTEVIEKNTNLLLAFSITDTVCAELSSYCFKHCHSDFIVNASKGKKVSVDAVATDGLVPTMRQVFSEEMHKRSSLIEKINAIIKICSHQDNNEVQAIQSIYKCNHKKIAEIDTVRNNVVHRLDMCTTRDLIDDVHHLENISTCLLHQAMHCFVAPMYPNTQLHWTSFGNKLNPYRHTE